jgi:hypothetical protein
MRRSCSGADITGMGTIRILFRREAPPPPSPRYEARLTVDDVLSKLGRTEFWARVSQGNWYPTSLHSSGEDAREQYAFLLGLAMGAATQRGATDGTVPSPGDLSCAFIDAWSVVEAPAWSELDTAEVDVAA